MRRKHVVRWKSASLFVVATVLNALVAGGEPSAVDRLCVKISDEGAEISEGRSPILFYQQKPKSLNGEHTRAGYVHPLYDLDGNILTQDFPEDHLHHRGIFWAWTQLYVGTTRVGNPWWCKDFLAEVERLECLEDGENSAAIRATVYWKSPQWTDPSGQSKQIVREITTIRTYRREAETRAIDFEIRLLALEKDVRIGGSENAKGYGGFSPRIRLPDGIRFTAAYGEVEPQRLSVAPSPTMAITAKFGTTDKLSGIAMLAHPSLPDFPPRWILRRKGSMQNAVYPGRDAVPLSDENPLVLRYRFVLHGGKAEPVTLARWAADYASEDKLKVRSGKPHWSQTEPFGHNVPKGLKTDTLDEVRDQLTAAGLVVEQGPTQVIMSQEQIHARSFVGTVVKFPDGHIHVSAGDQQRRSGDGGRTWKKIESSFTNYACRMNDGQTIQFSGRGSDGEGPGREPTDRPETIRIRAELIRSRDSGGTETTEEATIYLPAAVKRMTLRHARIVQLTDGSLLACSYISFEGDPWVTYPTWVTKTGIIHAKTFRKNRVIVIHSTDEGKTWNYRSTVAFDTTEHVRDRILGFAEPDMVALQNGEVIVFLRTVIGGGVRPMYMSSSCDGGQSWSDPDPVTDRGVSPCVIEMQNGVIVVVYGRPGNWLMFSTDRGKSWTGHFQFYMGPKSWDAWNQCAVEEVAPDTLLVTYRRTDSEVTPGTKAARQGDLLGTRFTVRRTPAGPQAAGTGVASSGITTVAGTDTAVLNREAAVHRRRRVILNDDAGMIFETINKPDDFVSKIATTVDTNVDSIWLSSMVGADLYVYDCKVGQRVGEQLYPGHEKLKGEAEGFARRRANMKVMLDAGTDPLREVIRFGHDNDKEVFASFRMNMVQDSWRPNFQTQWKRDHPDWCLGVREMSDLKDDPRSIFWSGLDFEKTPVRDQRIAVIEDICTHYDVDGMELDFWRWPMFFKPSMQGKPVEERHVEIMNNFLRRVRRVMAEIESSRNRPLILAARVFDNEKISLRLGLDARTWLREGLIDVLVVGGTYTYYDIDTEKWVAMARPHNIPVYVCMYRPQGIERDRARSAYHMSHGAAGMYLFNWLRSPAEELPALREIGDPQVIARRDKHYVMNGRFKTLGFRHVLPEHPLVPVRLKQGAWRTATLYVGDDVQTAAAEGVLAGIMLQLTMQNFSPDTDRLTVELNGQAMETPVWEKSQVSFAVDAPSLLLHDNRVRIFLDRGDPTADTPVEVIGVELKIDYR